MVIKNKVIIGGQWGDEGKGKVVDALAEKADVIIRYQGGANAGHTVEVGNDKYVFHMVPSGALHADKQAILSQEVVLDLISLYQDELLLFENDCVPRAPIALDPFINVTTNTEKFLDLKSNRIYNIGTTARGIGPTYGANILRAGIKLDDIVNNNSEQLARMLIDQAQLFGVNEKEILFTLRNFGYEKMKRAISSEQEKHASRLIKTIDFSGEAEQLKRTLDDILRLEGLSLEETRLLLAKAQQQELSLLGEGAQGILLDINHGYKQFVTSSNVANAEANIPNFPINYDKIGVFKAYATRVGNGPFPTELFNKQGRALQNLGKEFGATTGRKRRTGWFDLIAGKYAVEVAHLTNAVITKLDVLDSFPEIKVAVGSSSIPKEEIMTRKPDYKIFRGWMSDTTKAQTIKDLPVNARKYLNFLEEGLGVPIIMVSNGPSRDSLIYML